MIRMQNIWKSFGSNQVLKDVSITINDGEICALIGENGAGKSTLMNILGGVFARGLRHNLPRWQAGAL